MQTTFSIKVSPLDVMTWTPHLTHGTLDPPESTPISISIGSVVFAGLMIATDQPTDRQTHHATQSATIGRISHSSEMQPNNELCNIVVKDGTNQSHNINEIYNVCLH